MPGIIQRLVDDASQTLASQPQPSGQSIELADGQTSFETNYTAQSQRIPLLYYLSSLKCCPF